jgi:hypothetical protein
MTAPDGIDETSVHQHGELRPIATGGPAVGTDDVEAMPCKHRLDQVTLPGEIPIDVPTELGHQEAMARADRNAAGRRWQAGNRSSVRRRHYLFFFAIGTPLYGPSDFLWLMILPLVRSIFT